MRFPETDLSDQRRSHTAGPRLRFFLIKLQFCIVILRDRNSGAGKMFAERDRHWHAENRTKIIALRRQQSR
jgi:hypothetical protein